MLKLLILSDVCAPYRKEVFNGLVASFSVDVFFERWRTDAREASWYARPDDDFSFTVLGDKEAEEKYADALRNIEKYDAVICYDPWIKRARRLQRLCIKKKIPYILNADGAVDINLSFPKKQIKTYFVKRAALCLAGCNRAREYFEAYGAPKEKIALHPFTSMYAADILTEPPTEAQKAAYRELLGMPNSPVYISVGQFISRKGYDLLLEAWKKADIDASLYIIGGGPLIDEYKEIIEKNDIRGVHILGYMDKPELYKYYIAADAFVMPTREDIWGLVVAEAMAHGLPVISSNRCTAANELLAGGGGKIYPTYDTEALAECIRELASSEARGEMARVALDAVKHHTYENVIACHTRAILGILEK